MYVGCVHCIKRLREGLRGLVCGGCHVSLLSVSGAKWGVMGPRGVSGGPRGTYK